MKKQYQKHMQCRTKLFCLVLLTILSSAGCKKTVQVPAPVTSINAENVFQSTSTAVSATNEMYLYIQANASGSVGGLAVNTGLESDELTLLNTNSGAFEPFYANALTINTGTLSIWGGVYNQIFVANSVIEGVTASNTLSQAVKSQLIGEAKFMRAFYYFYMVNLYGDVPLAVTTNPNITRLLPRSSKTDVYAQIVQDLKDAQGVLANNFLSDDLTTTTTERVRPTKWAATALLARVYLYTGNYADAVTQATAVINNTSQFSLTDLNSTFLKNSRETIWALQSVQVSNYNNTYEGYNFVMGQTASPNAICLSPQLYNSFEPGDARKINWVSSATISGVLRPFAYKYKVGAGINAVTEYEVVFRLAEQYLIRAEAYARLGGANLANAVTDLNTIRTRARAAATVSLPDPLPALSSSLSQTLLYTAVEHERQVELFTEWGHRWLDLKRMPGLINPALSRADEVMPAVTQSKGGTWQSYQQLWPIPLEQLQYDPNMTNSQNPGY